MGNEELEQSAFGPDHPVNTRPFDDLSTKFSEAVYVENAVSREGRFREVQRIAEQRIAALQSEINRYQTMIDNAQREIVNGPVKGVDDGTD